MGGGESKMYTRDELKNEPIFKLYIIEKTKEGNKKIYIGYTYNNNDNKYTDKHTDKNKTNLYTNFILYNDNLIIEYDEDKKYAILDIKDNKYGDIVYFGNIVNKKLDNHPFENQEFEYTNDKRIKCKSIERYLTINLKAYERKL